MLACCVLFAKRSRYGSATRPFILLLLYYSILVGSGFDSGGGTLPGQARALHYFRAEMFQHRFVRRLGVIDVFNGTFIFVITGLGVMYVYVCVNW